MLLDGATQYGTAINDELSLGSGRYRSRFRIERQPFEAY
jgi:hypothetical protein